MFISEQQIEFVIKHITPFLEQAYIILQPTFQLIKEFSFMNEYVSQEIARIIFDFIMTV